MPTTLHENRPSAGIDLGRGAKTHGFLRFLKFPRDPLRGSAWSRCKNSWFFAISKVPARPSAGIGVVEVPKTRGFLLFELVLGSCLVVRAPAPGTGGSRVRFLPGPRAGVARCNLHLKATCAKHLAEGQLAQTNLHRPACAERLA